MAARLAARASVGTMAKVAWPAQDFSVASTTEVAISGLTRANLARFCAVSSSRWASTQALAALSPISWPATADSMIVLPAPVGRDAERVAVVVERSEAALDEGGLAGAEHAWRPSSLRPGGTDRERRRPAAARLRPAQGYCGRGRRRRLRRRPSAAA